MDGKILLLICSVLFLFVGCEKTNKASDYISVTFKGENTKGKAEYDIDIERLLKNTINYDRDFYPTRFIEKEIDIIMNSYTVELDKKEGLSNGDTVTVFVKVDYRKTNKLKSGKKVVKVLGLTQKEK